MKTLKSIFKALLTLLVTLLLTAGCGDSSDITGTTYSETDFDIAGNVRPSMRTSSTSTTTTTTTTTTQGVFPMVGSGTAHYQPSQDQYFGLSFGLSPSRTAITFDNGDLTPPPGHPVGENVVITARADFDTLTNQIIFTFGPHGCQFSSPAEIWLDYSELGNQVPLLYYIDDNGNYVQQQPSQVNRNKKWVKIQVHHFSRYALSHS